MFQRLVTRSIQKNAATTKDQELQPPPPPRGGGGAQLGGGAGGALYVARANCGAWCRRG